MKKTYVYVLVIESVTRGERDDLIIHVFGNIENAKTKLEMEYDKTLKEWKEWLNPDFLECAISKDSKYAEINEKYNLSFNHVIFSIYQKVIE